VAKESVSRRIPPGSTGLPDLGNDSDMPGGLSEVFRKVFSAREQTRKVHAQE
jgi:hypothetical protein